MTRRRFYQSLASQLAGGTPVTLTLDLAHHHGACAHRVQPTKLQEVSLHPIYRDQQYTETLGYQPQLFIYGAGHIGAAVASYAKDLDFDITVVDDRPEFLQASVYDDVETICHSFDRLDEVLHPTPLSFHVIVTSGHLNDRVCAAFALKSQHAYIGMIGSRAKIAKTFKVLEEQGHEQRALKEIYAPIGLNIGAQIPAEIALSILAEIVQVRRDMSVSTTSKDFWALMSDPQMHCKFILATIIEKRGSAPRGVGSRMIITHEGLKAGSIGGGAIERMVIERGQELLTQSQVGALVQEFVLSDMDGASIGMICGGCVTVLLEEIEGENDV